MHFTFIATLLVLCSYQLVAQPLNGTWTGALVSPANASASLQSSVVLRIAGQQLSGELRVQVADKQDLYVLKGTTNGTQGQGTATYPTDGSVFQFETALQQNQLLFAVGQNGTAILSGTLSRSPTTAAAKPNTATSPVGNDGLYRDPNLIGSWRTESNYGGGVTDGGFYGSTSSTMILRADGTFGDGGSAGYASGSGVSVQSSGKGNSALYAQLAAAGARWFTKGNLFYVRLKVNGQMQDVPSSKYYVENGKVLLTDLKTGKKMLYVKVN
ncbi:hypothetical protein IC229_19460 [Spirosoma sp. BT702]|uniref:Lipocalin-like domain-containing protein n=1 Tax=Spirosoma profusum TaxID=2771354 RepID=A0A926XXZ1_9BACT|nr:hypothetical protein [Spirosoma profusum]MBD2702834.1 hypothetical protein [Spirosoma profusum]